jgi:hypothetical protein
LACHLLFINSLLSQSQSEVRPMEHDFGFRPPLFRAFPARLLPAGMSVLAIVALLTPCAAQAERVQLGPGVQIAVRLDETVSTKNHYFGPILEATLDQDVLASNGRVAIPAGSTIKMAMAEFKRAGHVVGRAAIRLRLYSVVLPDGTEIPLDGYPTRIEGGPKPGKEGTFHGHRGWIKDAGFETTAVAVGAGAGLAVGGPLGLPIGAGAGLLTAGIWFVARRGPDLVLPAGLVIEFTLARPASVVLAEPRGQAGYFPSSDPPADPPDPPASASGAESALWGQGLTLPPSADLVSLLNRVDQPREVLNRVDKMNFRNRSDSDRVFAAYVRGLCEWRLQKPKQALGDFEVAYAGSKRLDFPVPAQDEIARNLVIALKASSKHWASSPLMSDPELQAVLVEPEGE